ncbi:MAG: hypothetical protein VCF24_06240 [Candidatus Latescibacterota bacterium]
MYYVIDLVLVAAAVLFVTSFALRQWEATPTVAAVRPWWLTWRRVALLVRVTFAFGALGPLSGSLFRGASPMFVLGFSVLPVLYNELRVGVRRFRLEQFLLWAIWVGGSVFAGGDSQGATLIALACWLPCVTFGAVVTKLGIRSAWTWEQIWKRQK